MNEPLQLFQELSRRYPTPADVQKFLYRFQYNHEKRGATLRSALLSCVVREAHCFEASFVAAAILECQGYPPLVLSLESEDLLDHIVYLFQYRNRWGAVGLSRDVGLNGRTPMFRSIKDLALSYVDPYVDERARVRGYQVFHLDETRAPWRDDLRNVWKAERYVCDLPHRSLKVSDRRHEKTLREYIQRGKQHQPQPYWW